MTFWIAQGKVATAYRWANLQDVDAQFLQDFMYRKSVKSVNL